MQARNHREYQPAARSAAHRTGRAEGRWGTTVPSLALQGTTRYRERQPHIAIPVEALRLIPVPTLTCLFEISAIGPVHGCCTTRRTRPPVVSQYANPRLESPETLTGRTSLEKDSLCGVIGGPRINKRETVNRGGTTCFGVSPFKENLSTFSRFRTFLCRHLRFFTIEDSRFRAHCAGLDRCSRLSLFTFLR